MTRFYDRAKVIVAPLMRAVWRPRVVGMENVPRSGGFIVASNHLANVDSFLIPIVFPRPVRFVSKDDFWKMPGLKGRIIRWFFNAVGTVPLDREALGSGRGALDAGLAILRDGEGFGIYPEGTRSKDGLLHAGKQGAAWLAIESGCPVVPVGLKGTQHMFDGGWWPDPGIVTVRVGEPMDFSDLDDTLPKGVRRRLITEQIMATIQSLSGQARAQDAGREGRRARPAQQPTGPTSTAQPSGTGESAQPER
ncbi:lysophospholipid acyltransferase family protein [Brachybacterium timonense]|uniref:lysophospholipid acyltransferase family protein n=1 Tax=Brachybacterium timonense TaxID=2050896 RepID=UPI003CCBD6BB